MSAAPAPRPGVSPRVLVVDDDPGIRLVVRAAFADADVVEAADGPTALALLERIPVDVVVLDVMMPGMDGYDVLERLRRQTSVPDAPVVLLTALAAETDRARAWRAGADAFVSKPFDIDDLAARVAEVLSRSSAERAAVRADELARAELLQHLEDAGL